jgi:hypothetical protein
MLLPILFRPRKLGVSTVPSDLGVVNTRLKLHPTPMLQNKEIIDPIRPHRRHASASKKLRSSIKILRREDVRLSAFASKANTCE